MSGLPVKRAMDTRIVYVAESGPGNRRIKRLAIMDQDGANHKFLTDGSSWCLTPGFSTTQEITICLISADKPRVYLSTSIAANAKSSVNFRG